MKPATAEAGTAVVAPGAAPLAVASEAAQIQTLLHLAVDKGVPVETLERLTKLYESMQEKAADRAIVAALAAFQAECPAIAKSKEAKDTSRDGGRVLYTYAPLDRIVKAIQPLLEKHGLAFSWNTTRNETGVKVTCVVSHLEGGKHYGYSDLPMTAGTSIMSAPQKAQASVTYAKRQALIDALGLVTCDEDTDAGPENSECISESQAADLRTLIENIGTTEEKVCAFAGVESIDALPATSYRMVCRTLEAKRR